MVDSSNMRYLRQMHAFPDDRRQASALAVFGADANPLAGMALLAGAAAMGIPVVGSDYHGPEESGHWLTGNYPDLLAHINAEVDYEYLDPAFPTINLAYMVQDRANPWAAILLNDMAHAREVLRALTADGVDIRVLLALAGPGGVVVERHATPLAAFERVEHLGTDVIRPGAPEAGILSAGLVLHEIMLAAGPLDDEAASGPIGIYSLRRPRRVATRSETEEDFFTEVTHGPEGPVASFTGSFVMVGAGALANWGVIPLVLDGPDAITILDGDPAVEPHNANRQIVVVNGVGKDRTKVDVLVEELQSLDRRGSYTGIAKFVRCTDDLPPLGSVDALICLPDNNQARFICDDARRGADVLFATAGSSGVGGQAIVSRPDQACLGCLGLVAEETSQASPSQSCSLVENDSVVSSNMVAAGLMIAELREALAGRPTANVRFVGDSARGNRLTRMITNPPCPHNAAVEMAAG